VVSDVAGNPLPPPAPPNTYTIQIPSCAFNCNVNQLPVAIAQNVTVFAGPTGTANANVDNGSHGGSPGETVTITQIPPGPYPLGTNNVILTVVDPFGATAQADAIVTVGGFSLTFSFPSILVAGGQTATNTVTFASSPATPALVNFTCSATLPRGSACSVSPTTLPAGSTAGSVTVTITTTQNSLLQRPRMFYAAWMPFAGMGLIGMIVVATPKKRRKAAVLLTFVVLGALVLLAGCGGGGGAKFGPIPVTVTATSGSITQSATFNLTIQD
jgi:hypothetical protein